MIIYSNVTDFHIEDPTVVSIGKFDGDHIGHQKIMSELRQIKEQKGYKTCLFTFSTSPADIIEQNGLRHFQISTADEKRHKFIYEGIDYLIEYPFDRSVAGISGEDFIYDILIGKLNMKYIVAGTDCSFGHNRSGNADLLRKLSVPFGYEVKIIEKIKEESGRDISSTLIKELLSGGQVSRVHELLGAYYTIEGPVQTGNRLGTVIGFPTLNIYPEPVKFIPKMGVYAVRVHDEDGNIYYGMTNIGTNPSIKNDGLDHRIRVETHLFDFDGDMYGKRIYIEFLEFIRSEICFDSVEDLKTQLARDKETIKELLK